MPRLCEQKIEVGKDWYGRTVTATRSKETNGCGKWKIEVHPSSQRDDGERIWSLTDDNMRDLAQCLGLITK